MKKKFTIATVATLSMVPMLMPSQNASAVPVFARKYGTSCYTCHSGFPTRNAFGEAFKNNGYRWPGGEDEEKSKQEQTKIGSDGWKKTFPESPWPADIPGYAPVAIYVTGNVLNYAQGTENAAKTARVPQTLNWNGPVDAQILFGGTVGNNLGVVGLVGGIGSGTTTTQLRGTWAFSPGVNLSFGNGFSAFSGLTGPITAYTSVFPGSGTGAEFNYVTGKSGGFQLIAGVASLGKGTNAGDTDKTYTLKNTGPGLYTLTSTSALTGGNANTNANKLDDTSYLRMRYKFGGAGLLSGAGGTYGNEFVGLDNSFNVGATVVGARNGILASNYKTESIVYGFDVSGNYGSFTGGAAWSRDRDLRLNNYAVDAGYFLYPWLLARVRYADLGVAPISTTTKSQNNPTITTSLSAWLRANVSLVASYKYFTKRDVPSVTDGTNNANTFTLAAGVAF